MNTINNIYKKKTYVKASCRVFNCHSIGQLCVSSVVDVPISETGVEDYDARGEIFHTLPDSIRFN